MTMLRANFPDLDLVDALPFIHHLVDDEFELYDDMIQYLFNVESSDQSIEQTSQTTGFSTAVQTPEGGAVVYDEIFQGYDHTYQHLKYTKGFRFSEELIDDNKWGLVQKAARGLGEAMWQTRQIDAATIFNNAFNPAFVGPDGVELCSLLHPLIGGGFEQNELLAAADLSVASLRQALNDMEDTTNQRGLLINLKPKWLLVPNEEQWTAAELVKSTHDPETGNNAINPFQVLKGELQFLVWNYLTDPDAWFLVSEPAKTELYWFDRKLPETESEIDFDTGSAKTKNVSRWSRGWSNWPGVFGSPGV